MPQNYTADDGSIFIQPAGPNTPVNWLGCHDLGDIAQGYGEVTQTYCPDPAQRGKWIVATISQAPKERATFSITMPVGKTADYLESAMRTGCEFAVYHIYSSCQSRKLFSGYERGLVLSNVRITSVTRSNFAARQSQEESSVAVEMSAADALTFFAFAITRQTTTEDQILTGVANCSTLTCAGLCGAGSDPCDVLYISAQSAVGPATANVLRSINGGVTWAACATDPFGAGEHANSVTCFALTGTITRVVAIRGLTDAGNPAEIGYSDNDGATWTNVNVGTTNGEFAQGTGRSIFSLDSSHVWCVTDQGNIYFSDDAAITWTLQATAGDALNSIHFIDENIGLAVGDTNEIQYTSDGGGTWTTITGPAAQAAVNALSCFAFNNNRWFVGYADGELWYTHDGGTNWTERVLPAGTGMANVTYVNCIDAIDDYTVYVAGCSDNAGGDDYGTVWVSRNGGTDWEVFNTVILPAASHGLYGIVACDYDKLVACGDVATTSCIYTGGPSA